MPESKFPIVVRTLRRRSFSRAQSAQAHLYTLAATVCCNMDTEEDTAFWCGVNYAMNDLWSLTINREPVFLNEFWRKLEEALSQ